MAHELDFSTGRAAIAYVGQTPWHGLGSELSPGADLLTWQQQAGLDWSAQQATVEFQRDAFGVDGLPVKTREVSKEHCVLYRSDTGRVLSVVSHRYKPVQPSEVIEFYRDLTERHGFTLETAGALKDGRKIWALARTNQTMSLPGNDEVRGYLLLATSYDGSMATQARFTSVRVVCNNTLSVAVQGSPNVAVPHSTTFNADKVKLDLKIGDAWTEFEAKAQAMAAQPVDTKQSLRFLLDVYLGTTPEALKDDEDKERQAKKLIARLEQQLTTSPGALMKSAAGTVWGLLNAITRDVDFHYPARNQDNRLASAWFGRGEAIKNQALSKALALVA